MSPCKNKHENYVDEDDQLSKIFDLLGQSSKEDLSFLSDLEEVDHAKITCKDKENKLRKKFQNINEDLFHILEGMLQFNPYFRLSA